VEKPDLNSSIGCTGSHEYAPPK